MARVNLVVRTAVLAMCATALAACGGNDGGDAAADGDVLTVAIGAEPSGMDSLVVSDGQRDSFGFSVQEGLTERTAEGIEPLLAESWKPQDGGFAFTLRAGVSFHDGSTLDAEDVVASYNRLLDPDLGSELRGNFVLEDTTVTALDDMTVLIKRPTADPTLLARTSVVTILPSEWAAVDDDRANSTMMGTGPYKFDSWTRGQDIKLSAFEDYWGDKPSINRVEVKFLPEEATRLAALQNNEIQLARNMSPSSRELAPQSVGVSASEVLILVLNTKNGPMTDVRLRQAANLAIDRDLLRSQIYEGAAESADGQAVAKSVFGHSTSVQDPPFDPDAAKQLLEDADAVGTELWMTGTTGRWMEDSEVGQAMASMLEDVGFKVRFETPEFTQWLDLIYSAHDESSKAPDVFPFNHSNQLFDTSQTLSSVFTCEGAVSAYCEPEFDQLAEKALAEQDTDKRAALYDQAWQFLADDSAFVSVSEVQQIACLAENLEWTLPVDGFLRFQDMRFT